MTFKQTLLYLLQQEERLSADTTLQKDCAVPENCYLLDNDFILCRPRGTGDSRYPYAKDGFTIWAYSSGYISLNESTFYYILPASEGKEPYVAFFGGIDNGNGFTPVSVTGVARQPIEKDVLRFTVYTPEAVYYVTKTTDVAFCLRAFVSDDKKAVFSLCALNISGKDVKISLNSFFNCLCMYKAGEDVETKWFKQCKITDCGFIFESVEDLDRTTHLVNFGVINRSVKANVLSESHTTSRSDAAGGKNNPLCCSKAFFDGKFEKENKICRFDDTASAGDIYVVNLDKDQFAVIDYVLEAVFDPVVAEKAITLPDPNYADACIEKATIKDNKKMSSDAMLKIQFGKWNSNAINNQTLTKFVGNVIRQVEFGALAKNSGVSLLGVRDVVQQIEAALMWNPSACRSKLLELLNFIDPCGRPPRQYSIPAKGALPRMDTRAFIDQGNWIISAIHTYLAFTDDYSILDEICGYYKIVGHNQVEAVDERNSVAEHLCRIMDYLIVNIDPETNCLRALYGDWNDALDGLGVSSDPNKEYGSGVSVMASLHLYKNLAEMQEIVSKYGDKFNQNARYVSTAKNLKNGLMQFALDEDGKGGRKILHGWGDKRAYKVGSYKDIDGVSRDGLAANAFWVISGMYEYDKTIKKDILASYQRLDSKYGLKTFHPYFAPGTKGVGRIINLPKGTAENAATYVHATMFGIWSLFGMGEGKLAWEQLEKALPITHKLITTTPFIMSNSYSYNEELELDGDSMSDWFTGSANVLIKTLVWYVFGVRPDLNGVNIFPAKYRPFGDSCMNVSVKGCVLKINYTTDNTTNIRYYIVNGKKIETENLYLSTKELKDKLEITVYN